jgi:hypothetical protein
MPRRPKKPGSSDVVDVVLPFYIATAAIASGAYDRLLGPQDRPDRRYRWDMYVGERIAFPTPLAGAVNSFKLVPHP